jgi:hypothetical protein
MAVIIAWCGFAAEIHYTGAGAPGMLSDPLNWSERPGETSMCRIAGPFTATSGTLCAERILLGASNGQSGFFENKVILLFMQNII